MTKTAKESSSDSLLLRPFAWMSAALVVTVMFIATILVSLSAILHTLQSNQYQRAWLIFEALVAASVVIAFFLGLCFARTALSNN